VGGSDEVVWGHANCAMLFAWGVSILAQIHRENNLFNLIREIS
jgi:hypothetical protein